LGRPILPIAIATCRRSLPPAANAPHHAAMPAFRRDGRQLVRVRSGLRGNQLFQVVTAGL